MRQERACAASISAIDLSRFRCRSSSNVGTHWIGLPSLAWLVVSSAGYQVTVIPSLSSSKRSVLSQMREAVVAAWLVEVPNNNGAAGTPMLTPMNDRRVTVLPRGRSPTGVKVSSQSLSFMSTLSCARRTCQALVVVVVLFTPAPF
ncbi:hypothetical protein ASF45_16005 [Pseudorhodoferax sp. Leaf265]|nr:hypothetical protein ASF45_16005 [Pseudorhodoferax sp. Leaf265]